MDRATLDAAYNNGAAVDDSDAWLADWRARSGTSRALAGARLDVPYGEQQRERFDYFPCGVVGAPLFVFIHGGYWQRNAKEMFSFVSEGPRAHGVDVAILGYTLTPEARLSDIVREIEQALAFFAHNAGQFGFNPEKIYAGGWSAGGHLAAVAGQGPRLRGALSISGILDLEPMALCYINEKLQLDDDEIETLSPVRMLHRGMAPLHLAVGGDELPELQRQSVQCKEKADSLGLPVSLRVLPGCHHYSILDELAQPDGLLTAELLRLIARPGQP
jgi:arylformamidase